MPAHRKPTGTSSGSAQRAVASTAVQRFEVGERAESLPTMIVGAVAGARSRSAE